MSGENSGQAQPNHGARRVSSRAKPERTTPERLGGRTSRGDIRRMKISPNVEQMQPSATIAVSTLAKKLTREGRDIVDLSAGQPDFDTPEHISQAGIDGIRAGGTRYTPTPGTLELREAIAAFHGRESAIAVDPAGIVVSNGAKQSIFNACFCLFGPGDEVLVGAPYWTSYPEMVGLARATPVPVTGPESSGFKLTPEALTAATTDRTKGLLFSTPSNPSGAVYSREELLKITRWARDHDIWLLSDEIYQRIYYGDGVATGLLQLPPEDVGPNVVFNGASKAFAMTGWRIGYSISTAELASKMNGFQSHTTSNAAAPSQLAALAAYDQVDLTDRSVDEMVVAFRRRRDLAVRLFGELLPEVEYVEPEGAFYLFFRLDAAFGGEVTGSAAACTAMIQEEGVAIVPGVAFGDDRYARMSFASADEVLEDGVRRIARWMRARL